MINYIVIGILTFLLLTILTHLVELAAVVVAVGTVCAVAFEFLRRKK